LKVDTPIYPAFVGEQLQSGQSLNPEKENYSQVSTLNLQLIEKAAVQMDAKRLKLIDELFRLIPELEKQFPEIAQQLSKVKDNVSVSSENIPVKNLINLFSEIQQNLNVFARIEKPEIAETIKKLASEVIKILQPNPEIPAENKLLLALSKNDFASANAAIKNIVETVAQVLNVPQTSQNIQTPQTPQATQMTQATQATQTFQIIFNALQELKELGIPKELQNAPLKELETIILQKNGIEVPKNSVKNLSAVFGEKPIFAVIMPLMEEEQYSKQPRKVASANMNMNINVNMNANTNVNTNTNANANINPNVNADTNANVNMNANTYVNTNANANINPNVNADTNANVNTNTNTNVNANANANINPNVNADTNANVNMNANINVNTNANVNMNTNVNANINPNTDVNINTNVNTNINTYVLYTHTFEIPLPKNFPLQIPPDQKIEMAFSLHQIQNQNQTNETKFVLQPWIASVQIPKEERDFWLKTGLPLTPQILNIRDAILSSDKLPENPETARLFASGMHELSLQTEQGASISKEQANLLWRVVQTATANNELSVTNSQWLTGILKYQPLGNYEGDLFKDLPEPVKRELLQELPQDKTWQPEILQKVVEKILAKHIEQPQVQTQAENLNEHSGKAHEEIKNTLQNLKEQIQWTRIDQDTRLQNDRENVFYFMHDGELQKGRLKVKDERKGGSKNRQDSSISFTIETRAKNLGEVHADLTLNKSILNIRLQDEFGGASEAVKEERETLAKELADIGITLGELLYGKTPKIQNLPVAKKEKNKGGLDVRA